MSKDRPEEESLIDGYRITNWLEAMLPSTTDEADNIHMHVRPSTFCSHAHDISTLAGY